MTLVGNNTSQGVHYHPSHPKFLFETFENLNIDYDRYTFVDLGSGKGRVLLVASEFPFREIIGVEFASELNAIAADNVRRYRSETQKCETIKTLNLDAAEFDFPPTPLVLYLFNPFGADVLREVMLNMQASLKEQPRDVTLIYMAPFHGSIIERETDLKCAEQSVYHRMYQLRID